MAHSFNAVAYAAILIEDPNLIADLRDGAVATYKPANSQELFACERIALAQASLSRCAILEAGFHNVFMNECIRPGGLPHNLVQQELARNIEVRQAQNRALCLTTGFDRIFRETDAFKLFLRYRDQSRREYREAREDIMQLIQLRDTLDRQPFEVPATLTSEPMPPPPPLTDDTPGASPYDPTISISTPVPQTKRPKIRIRRRTAVFEQENPPIKGKFTRAQPRFGTYPQGREVPDPIRQYGATQDKPPTT